MALKCLGAELELDQFSSFKHHSQARQELAHLTIRRGQVFKASRFLDSRFLHLVKWKTIQQGGIVDVATYLQEFLLEAFKRLLEESQEDSPRHSVEAQP